MIRQNEMTWDDWNNKIREFKNEVMVGDNLVQFFDLDMVFYLLMKEFKN